MTGPGRSRGFSGLGGVLVAAVLALGCSRRSSPVATTATPSLTGGSAPSAAPAASSHRDPSAGRAPGPFVLLFVGDGMGPVQMTVARRYGERSAPPGGDVAASFDGFSVQTSVATASANSAVTDSAAAATALATGHRTNNGRLGLGADGVTRLESVATLARRHGLRAGLVSSVSLDHATPAAFYAHQQARGAYAAIAAELVTSGFDYFGGGGLLGAEAAPTIWDQLARRGYSVRRDDLGWRGVPTLPAFVTAPELDAESALPYELDREPGAPRLADFTRQAIAALRSDRGFFLMVEGGRIDWACHANDLAAATRETLEFFAAVAVGSELLAREPQRTLVVVTADHETGGLAFDGGAGDGLAALRRATMSHAALARALDERLGAQPAASFDELRPLLERVLGEPVPPAAVAELRRSLEALRRRYASAGGTPASGPYGAENPLVDATLRWASRRAGASWATHDHTATPVRLYAEGLGAERLSAVAHHADVGRALLEVVAGAGP